MTTEEAVRTPRAPGPADVQPVAHETLDRTLVAVITVVPMVALGIAAWRSWDGLLRPPTSRSSSCSTS